MHRQFFFSRSRTRSNGGGGGGLGPSSVVLDLRKEKRAQKFLLMIVIVSFVCLLPLNVLK